METKASPLTPLSAKARSRPSLVGIMLRTTPPPEADDPGLEFLRFRTISLPGILARPIG
jgi:hypothetical protein